MTEQEVKQYMDSINKNLTEINKKTGSSVWRSFLTGTLSGLGSVVGVAIALAVIGWILNVVGVIPAFRAQVSHVQSTLDQLQKNR